MITYKLFEGHVLLFLGQGHLHDNLWQLTSMGAVSYLNLSSLFCSQNSRRTAAQSGSLIFILVSKSERLSRWQLVARVKV